MPALRPFLQHNFYTKKKKYKNVNNFVISKYADSSIWSALSNDRFLSFQLASQSTSILRSSAVSFWFIVFKLVQSSVRMSSSCCLRSELWLRPCLLEKETNKLQHDNASVCYNDRARIHVQLLEFCVKKIATSVIWTLEICVLTFWRMQQWWLPKGRRHKWM